MDNRRMGYCQRHAHGSLVNAGKLHPTGEPCAKVAKGRGDLSFGIEVSVSGEALIT